MSQQRPGCISSSTTSMGQVIWLLDHSVLHHMRVSTVVKGKTAALGLSSILSCVLSPDTALGAFRTKTNQGKTHHLRVPCFGCMEVSVTCMQKFHTAAA